MKRTIVPEFEIARIFPKKRLTLALAESCTGGLASHLVTLVPGSSAYFLGSVVSYSNEVKTDVLGVLPALIKKHGAVSRQVAASMAEGARKALSSDMAASVTGIAGPAGARPGKPVGTAFMAVAMEGKTRTKKVNFSGTREELKAKFADSLLKFVLETATRHDLQHRVLQHPVL